MRSRYELACGGRIGPGAADVKELRMLNRIIRWTTKGVEYDADPRQVEKLLAEIELEGANGAATPGQKVLQHQAAEERDLPESDFTRFRALAASQLFGCGPHRDLVRWERDLQVHGQTYRCGHGG